TFRVTKFSHACEKLAGIFYKERRVYRREPQHSDDRSLFGSLAHCGLRRYREGTKQAYEFATSHRLLRGLGQRIVLLTLARAHKIAVANVRFTPKSRQGSALEHVR